MNKPERESRAIRVAGGRCPGVGRPLDRQAGSPDHLRNWPWPTPCSTKPRQAEAGGGRERRQASHRCGESRGRWRARRRLFARLSMLLQKIPYGFFDQIIEPTVLIHGKVGQIPHKPLVQPETVILLRCCFSTCHALNGTGRMLARQHDSLLCIYIDCYIASTLSYRRIHEASENLDTGTRRGEAATRCPANTGLHDQRLYPFAHRTGLAERTVNDGTSNERAV